jgi:tetratricopeptide (TPR) repeat protein
VNATPPLVQVTTSSLDALRKYSEAARANSVGDRRAVGLAREAVALDSTFASAWSMLGAVQSNYGGTRSAIDSALAQAYRYRERLPELERESLVGRYYGMGPGRDRAKSVAAYEAILRRGDTLPAVLINLGELLRSRREFARAESLNVIAARLNPGSGTALGNAVEMQLNQGKFKEAAATTARLKSVSVGYAAGRTFALAELQGDDRAMRSSADSMLRNGSPMARTFGIVWSQSLALRDGRLREYAALVKEAPFRIQGTVSNDQVFEITLEIAVKGPSPSIVARLDSAIARVPFRDLPLIDRPYFAVATALARVGSVDKARAMIARYHEDVTDTSIVREQSSDLHNTLGEIALAAGKPQEAVAEFRRADVGYDGAPANECAPCLPFNLARAYDAAGRADAAASMFEHYLATPYWLKPMVDFDPVRVPAIRERLAQLYESMGKGEKAVENYRAFIELWKNADAELQPRVADARRRLARLTPVEKPRP